MTGQPTPLAASVIIVSRHRPAALCRCLTGLSQSDHPRFEVIVVADPVGVTAVRAGGWPVKLATFDEPNISAARNVGLGLASAPVVAFIDDDAVPEPTWLSRLVAPFSDGRVMQAGGFVRGRNGISFQWRAMEVDAAGQDHPLAVAAGVSLHAGNARRAVKTQGTNCAFRRDDLLAIGGFDPGYRFYLDEADVNLRLAARGLTAVVPGAEVHHGFAASARRRADRVPTDLTDIGASIAHFLRRHGDGDPDALRCHRAQHRARLLRLMVEGRIEPRDVRWLMASLAAGMAEPPPGRALLPLTPSPLPLLPLPGTGPRPGRVIAGRIWQGATLRARAEAAVAAGEVVTVLNLSPTARAHYLAFQPGGYWMQRGGLFGRSDRAAPRVQPCGFHARVDRETRRTAPQRPVSPGQAVG
ncbi:glycosyltransferase family 2 protein [Paracoccaceae bacterium Fryx2]|nr:glycosyltransferase family 2 protein [Paracoccaceae bacterium Fryx2]